MLDNDDLLKKLIKLMFYGTTDLPSDVRERIEQAYKDETSEIAKSQLRAILDNIHLAKEEGLPLCQDTGIQVFFIKAGYDFPYLKELNKLIPKAIQKATEEIPLRPNTVDPFTGENPKNNLGHNMPAVTIELVEGNSATVQLLPKGGGSENMSALWMLTPAEGFGGMKRRIYEHVLYAGGKPCPPIVLGIGIGGGADIALKLAKKALLRPLDQPNPDPKIAEMESELLEDVNSLGIGPMGMGGDTTALAVQIEYTNRHPATFPVGLVVQCWCDRRQTIRINKDGEVNL